MKELKEQFEPQAASSAPEEPPAPERQPEPAAPQDSGGGGTYSLWDDAANAAAPVVETSSTEPNATLPPASVAAADINDLFSDVLEGAALDPIEEAKRLKEEQRLAAEAEKEQRARERAEKRAELQAKKDAAQAEAEALRAQREAALQAALEEETAEERAAKAAEEKKLFEEKVAAAAEKAAKRMLRDEAAQERKARKDAERETRRARKAEQRRQREMEKLDERRAEKERKEIEALVLAQTDEIYEEKIAELMPPAPTLAPAAPAARGGTLPPVARSFRAKAPALIRAGFAANSAERGILEPGQIVTAQTVRRNERLGVTRIKFEQGWVSTRAGDGTTLLVELDSAGNEIDAEDDETEVETMYETARDGVSETDWTSEMESETEFETELEDGSEYTYAESIPDSEYSTGDDSSYGDAPLAEQYLVVSPGKIRAGWEMDAPEVGVTQEDQIIDVIEGRALDTGVLRVRFSLGWVSTQAGDGTQLLLPVGDDDSSTEFETEMASETEFETEMETETDFETEQLSETEFETDYDSETEFETEMSTGDSETYAASSVASETEFETDTSMSETQFETDSEASTEWTETTEMTETVMTETDFSETELTETQAATEAPLPDEGPEMGSKLEVTAPARVRRRFEPDSEDLGTADVGQVLVVLDTQKTANGIWRVCFSQGDDASDRRWMSVMAGDGTQLLRAVRGLEDWIPPAVVQELAEEYIVVAPVKVRQAFDSESKTIMEFEPGTQRKPSKVKPLEGKQDDKGVMQLRVQYGWVSTHDSDGTVLLLAVRKNVAAKKYRAVADAMIRAEFDVGSRQVGVLEKTDVIEVSESKVTEGGVLRVKGRVIRGRTPHEGWVSEKAKDGTLLLAVLEERDLEAEIKAQEFRPGIHTASKYIVKHPALVRAQFAQTSAERGILEPGEVIHVLEGRETEAGILRVKCEKGWVSIASKDGTALLAALGEDGQEEVDDSASEFDDDDDETEFSTGGDSWEEDAITPAAKYCVIAQSKVRAGFDQDSEDMGVIDPGQVVTTLEGRVNANGVMRIRFGGGWLSTVAADGTALLTEVIEEDDEEDDLETVYTLKSETDVDESEASESDMETVTDVTEFGRDLSRQYIVKHTALLREGVSQNTRGCGTVKPGEVVDVLEGRINELGIMRVRISKGWLSVKSSDGTALLEPIKKEEADADETDESDVSYETETQTATSQRRNGPAAPAQQYRVVASGGAKVRSGFEATSEDAGVVAFGETIDVLDGRLNAGGVMRVQFEQGWVNTKAGDGTVLLEPVQKPASQYRVAAQAGAKVRAGFAAASKDLGAVGFDQVLDVLDGRPNPSGVMRIKFQHGDTTGWVNTKAGDGTVLLEPVGGDGDEGAEEDESDYSYETETATSRKSASSRRSRSSRASSRRSAAARGSAPDQYTCLVPSKCRAEFEMQSKDMGILKPNEIIDVLESRLLKPGVLRIRFKKGDNMVWVSTAAGDGTPLLQAVETEEDDETESEFESESEAETATATETDNNADPFASESSAYKVLFPAKVRAGFEATSADAGICKPGEIIRAITTRRNAGGILRIQFDRGWVSEKAMDGTTLLSAIEAQPGLDSEDGSEWETATASETASGKRSAFEQSTDDEGDTDTDTESESGWETATASEDNKRLAKFMQETVSHTPTKKQYRVEVPARVRAGFEAASEDRGIAQPGEVVDVLESRENDAGILRVRYTRGWISEFAGDGTRLLAAVGAVEEEEADGTDWMAVAAKTDFDDSEFDDLDEFSESEFETDTVMSTGDQVKVYNYAESDFETVGESSQGDTFVDDVADQYKVMAPAQIRAEFDTNSKRVGEAKVGQVIDILEARLNPAGIVRVRYQYGWLNVEASDGTVLLKPVFDDATDSEFDETDDAPKEVTQYRVEVPARVRAGFEAASEDRGIAQPGEVVDVLESRENDAGILRVRYTRGWISEFAGDGSQLLTAVEFAEDDDESEFETETDMTKGTAIDRFEAIGTAASKYVVIATSKVRGEFETDSAVMGALQPGEVIETVEGRMNPSGIMRVRFSRDTVPYGGWVSVRAGDGTRLLQPVDRRIAEIEEESETEFETDTQVSDESETSVYTTGEEEWRRYTPDNADDFQDTCQRYTVLESTVVRTEFDSTSQFVGTLSTGEVVECLESRVDSQGALRIKCSIGWFSECASDGTNLVREGTQWYRVASQAVVRTGRDISSSRSKRDLMKDEVIEALEVWRIDSGETEAGLLRVRFQRGWTSVTAGNGVTLLVPLPPEETVVQEAAKKLLLEQRYGPVGEKKPKKLQKWQIRMEAEKKAREVVLAKIKEEAEWFARVEEAKKTSVTMTEVAKWLEAERLPQFQRRFDAEGFDDLKTLKMLTYERMEAVVEAVGDGMKRGHVLKLRVALEKLLDHARDGTVKPPKLYGLDEDPDETAANDTHLSSHAQLLDEGAFVAHSFDTHYPIPTEDELAALAAAEAAAEAAALEAAETAAAEAKKKTEAETAKIVAEAKAKMAQEAIDADARASSAHAQAAAEAAAKEDADKVSTATLEIAEAAENKWVAAGEERARVTAAATGAASAAAAARVSADEAMERRAAAQQWLVELKVALGDKEKAAAASGEKLGLEEENLRLAGIEVPRVEAISQEVAAARQALEDEAASLVERERNASLEGRLDDEKAVDAEQRASRTAMLAAQLQEQTLTKALLDAATRGDTRAVELLLTQGIDSVKPHVDVVDANGEAAITKAALNGHKEAVALLRTHGANLELLPVAHWSIEQVARWFDQFSWFGKYATVLASAMIDGAALLEYGTPGEGERLLQTDLDIAIGAHRRVLLARIGELCAREDARAARQLAAAQAEKLALTAAIAVKGQEKMQAVEAEARARLMEVEKARALRLDEKTQLLERTSPRQQQQQQQQIAPPADYDPVPEESNPDPVPEGEAISVSIRTPSGDWHKMNVAKGMLVQELQTRLALTCGVPVRSQTLLHKLRPLQAASTLGACGVDDKSVIHLKSSQAQPRKLKLLLK